MQSQFSWSSRTSSLLSLDLRIPPTLVNYAAYQLSKLFHAPPPDLPSLSRALPPPFHSPQHLQVLPHVRLVPRPIKHHDLRGLHQQRIPRPGERYPGALGHVGDEACPAPYPGVARQRPEALVPDRLVIVGGDGIIISTPGAHVDVPGWFGGVVEAILHDLRRGGRVVGVGGTEGVQDGEGDVRNAEP
ncbi:hypothetical protein VTI28DRAFT_5938 [Corynascus sepedonium]